MLRRLAALAAALFVSGPGLASHMGQYATNPVEHDDQGRSDEPDFQRTGVLGPSLENKVLDLDLDGLAVPDSQLPPPPPGQARVIAPGCTDDTGRRPSGLCGVCTVGAGSPPTGPGSVVPANVFCAYGYTNRAPGAYTPRRDTVIRFLDVRFDTVASAPLRVALRLDLNHKLDDTGLRALTGLDRFVAGPTSIWAWLGDWQDKNGNGVIDHVPGPSGSYDGNEFVWHGGCAWLGLDALAYCVRDPPPTLLIGFAFPGDHHADPRVCVGVLVACVHSPVGDPPGAEVACWAGVVFHCFAYSFYHFGDPLLGPQDSVGWDEWFQDNTGHPDIQHRGWFYEDGWPVWYYDQSLAVGHVFVASYRAPFDPASPNRVRLAEAAFLDVDAHRALSPEVEQLLQGQLKPALRGAWLLARAAVEGVPGA